MTTEPRTVLFGWARTGDEDLNEPFGAFLPITAGAHIRNANDRSEQIGGVNVFSHMTALLRAIHELLDCSLDEAARACIEPGRASGHAVERWGNDVLCGDVIDKQQQPGSQGLDRGHRGGESVRCRSQFFHFTLVDRFDECIPCREMAIQGSGSDSGLLRDVVQTGTRAVARKSPPRHFENTFAVAQSIRSRLSRGGLEMLLLHFAKNLATGDCLRLSDNSETGSVLIGTIDVRQF